MIADKSKRMLWLLEHFGGLLRLLTLEKPSIMAVSLTLDVGFLAMREALGQLDSEEQTVTRMLCDVVESKLESMRAERQKRETSLQ